MGYKLGKCDIHNSYRYSLYVSTDHIGGSELVVIQCNPSTASSVISDSTVGKVARWAEESSFSEVIFLNLFALISTNPAALAARPYLEIVGPKNDDVLEKECGRRDRKVVLAWGGNIPVEPDVYQRRIGEVKNIVTAAGHVVYHVGALSYGTHPRHGRMWNKGNRDLRLLDWASIGA